MEIETLKLMTVKTMYTGTQVCNLIDITVNQM